MALRRIRSGSWIVEMREKAGTQSRLTVQSSDERHAEAKPKNCVRENILRHVLLKEERHERSRKISVNQEFRLGSV